MNDRYIEYIIEASLSFIALDVCRYLIDLR